jgi:hypothetical protein
MVKITGPALSLSAAGTLGKTLTYQTRPRGNAVYLKSKPGRISPFVDTPAQYIKKTYFSEAIRHWHLLSPAEKLAWEAFIKS